jgi:outer membrane lipoprotein-sorting protein
MWSLVLVVALVFVNAPVWAGDAVSFSGNVKKVIVAKNKVAIKDPATKKRFTVVVNDQSKLTGISGIGDLKKGDSVSGQYVVTDKGLYVVTEMAKK